MAQEAAADHDGGEIRLQHQRLAERFHHDHGFDRAGAKAAIGLRKGQTQQALLGELAPDGLAPAALLLLVLLARIEIVGVGQETVDAFLEKALLLGQIKIHFLFPESSLKSWSLRWTDFFLTSPRLRGEVGAQRRVRGYRSLDNLCSRRESPSPSPREERGEGEEV